MIKSFTTKLDSKCRKLGYFCTMPYQEDGKFFIKFMPIDDYDRVNIKIKSNDINNPSFYIDILDNEISLNTEFVDYIQVLKNAQNLLSYLNKIDWTKCPTKSIIGYDFFNKKTTLVHEGSSKEFKL